MADNIEKIVLENEDTRVLVEAGVSEALAELGEDIGENLKTLVDLITATAVEYGANSSDISKGHALTFSLFGATGTLIGDTIFNYASDDPWEKALAKAIAASVYGVIGGFVSLGFKGAANVAVGYGTGLFITDIVDKGYDIVTGPDYELRKLIDDEGNTISDITVDYTLKDALLIPDKLREFLKNREVSGNWQLTDRNNKVVSYDVSTNEYSLRNTTYSQAVENQLIDGLLFHDSNGVLPINLKFSDTEVLIFKGLYYDNEELEVLANNDGKVLWALNNLKSYYEDSPSANIDNISDFSEQYIKDRALLLYLHNWKIKNIQENYTDWTDSLYDPETSIREYLRAEKTYIIDNQNNVQYGVKFLGLISDHKVIEFGTDKDDKNYTYTNNDDRLYGGLGDDIIEAGEGNNLVDGGSGNDTISYEHSSSKISINLSLATAQAINSTTTDTLVNIENVIGSRYADNITGKDNTTTTLNGGFGNDTLKGGNNSENMLLGEDGDDYIYGGITTDEIMLNANKLVMNYLDGGAGKDYLVAGKNANNYLYGGAGNDTLVSTLIGFKNESAGIDYSKGSSYLNGGIGTDTYVVKDYVTIEDEDGLGEIQTTYGNLQDLTMRTYSDGRVLLLKNYPIYIDGEFATVGNFGRITTTRGMLLDNYVLVFKLSKDGNDLILDDLSTNPTVIRIKNYTENSLKLNITQDMFNTLPNYDENNSQTPTPVNPTLIGTNEVDTLIGSNVNNTFISNAGNDTIIFDESVKKEDITFSQSEDLKSLIINYSATDSITITNYFDSFSKIENIEKRVA